MPMSSHLERGRKYLYHCNAQRTKGMTCFSPNQMMLSSTSILLDIFWHIKLFTSLPSKRLPLGFMGITQAPPSCLYSPSCLLSDRCPLTSRSFPVSACAPSPKAATDRPSSVPSLRQPIHEWVSFTTSVYLKIKLFLTTHFSSNFRTVSLSFYHINFLKEKNGVVSFNQTTYQNH